MMLQTLVENSIKHGISKLINGGLVRIVAGFTDHHLELLVQNTGYLNGKINGDAGQTGLWYKKYAGSVKFDVPGQGCF
ncbi:MAG: hypothetical protein IPJ02_11135 [Chitinophagaceae bacterium]|nr:hypothetical protein [Chitinophagaceae bacterium]